MAKDAGNVLGLELSLTTDEYVKLLDNGEGIKGIEVLGASHVDDR